MQGESRYIRLNGLNVPHIHGPRFNAPHNFNIKNMKLKFVMEKHWATNTLLIVAVVVKGGGGGGVIFHSMSVAPAAATLSRLEGTI